jgi:hypothetical protein
VARSKIVVAGLLALGIIGAARAQERSAPISPEGARRSLGRFLTEGELAPFEHASAETALAGVTLERPLASGEITFARRGEFTAVLDSAGDVALFSRAKPLLFVGGDGPAREAELRKRVHFSLEDDAARARRFLEQHYPDFRGRRFELTSKERVDRDSLVEDELVFIERPRSGVAACWPNRIDVSLDPEDGTVSTYRATNDRIESDAAPTLDSATARSALVRVLGDRVRGDNRDYLARQARIELVAFRDREQRPVTAWLVAGIFIVDATSGELLARRGP